MTPYRDRIGMIQSHVRRLSKGLLTFLRFLCVAVKLEVRYRRHVRERSLTCPNVLVDRVDP